MKYLLSLLLLFPLFLISQTQIGEDIDGEAAGDISGFTLSMSSDGSIVAISAPFNEGNGDSPGVVRVYENIGGTWTQIGQDIYGEDISFSLSISSNGSILAVGFFNYLVSTGKVRVFENVGGTWTQIGQDINGEDPGNDFGYSLSISSDGSVLAVGAPVNDNINGVDSGHVRVFENIGGTWTQIGQDIDGDTDIEFSGASISLSSNGLILAVGAARHDGVNGTSSGRVRVYENIGGTWIQIGQDIEGEAINDFSGGAYVNLLHKSITMSSDGSIVAIGATQNDGNGSGSGHVRVFENIGGTWTQIGQDIDGESFSNSSGNSISFNSSGNIIAIGANRNNGINGFASGHVRVFKNISGVWTQIGQDIDGEAADDNSGISTSISSDGSIIAIGAHENDGMNGIDSGHVRVYSIASELGLLEVVEDILSNANGVNITAEELNGIIGVSGAIDGVNYTLALQNGTYVDPNNPTAAEIQAVINQVNDTLGLSENDLLSFNLYPNPTKNQFTIQLNDASILEKVTIYNTLGQQVLTSENTVIDTSKLASGSYIVEIITTKGKASKQLIIE